MMSRQPEKLKLSALIEAIEPKLTLKPVSEGEAPVPVWLNAPPSMYPPEPKFSLDTGEPYKYVSYPTEELSL